jgi:hypothetical protein
VLFARRGYGALASDKNALHSDGGDQFRDSRSSCLKHKVQCMRPVLQVVEFGVSETVMDMLVRLNIER